MSFAVLEQQIHVIADLFLGVANADAPATEIERDYARRQLEDLLSVTSLPESLTDHMARFDAASFDVEDAGAALREQPPMRPRRLLELVAFVAVADGNLGEPEDRFIRKLGAALGLGIDKYRDLTLDHESRGPRRTFTQMAVVEVPDGKGGE
jgi:uncharacterized tellurite resistance protein B-like protein